MMKTLFSALLALALAACGGSEPMCMPGQTPIVTAGAQVAAPPGACVKSADATAESVQAAVHEAIAETGAAFVYLIAANDGAAAALDYMTAQPGHVSIASLWFTKYDPAASRLDALAGSVATYHFNAGDDVGTCEALAARLRAGGSPAVCTPGAAAFDAAQAIAQLHLP